MTLRRTLISLLLLSPLQRELLRPVLLRNLSVLLFPVRLSLLRREAVLLRKR